MKKVLVLCTANASRSQMAEGYLRYYAGERAEFFSAGVDPQQVNPLAIRVMAEDNIDISAHATKSYLQFRRQAFDFLITVCDDALDHLPEKLKAQHKLHFSIPDPDQAQGGEQARLQAFRDVRERVKRDMLKFIGRELSAATKEVPA